MLRTVRARLTAFTILVVAVILTLMGLFVRARVHTNLISDIDRQLREEVGTVRTGKPNDDTRFIDVPPDVRPLDPSRFTPHPLRGQVTEILRSKKDEVRLEARMNAPRLIPADEPRPGLIPVDDPVGLRLAAKGAAFHDFTKGAEPMRSLTSPVRREGRLIAYVQSVRSLRSVRHQMADLDRALQTSIPVAILLAAFGGALLVGSAMRPLRRMNLAARDHSRARLPIEGQDEFAELAGNINAAFDEQRRVLAQLERFTGDAGHELRTPLATIKTNASFLLHMVELPPEHRPVVQSIDVSADRMTKLIGDLLLLARQDAGQRQTKREKTFIRDLICGVSESLVHPGIEVKVLVDSTLEAAIDRDAVERVTENLLSNAVRYARESVAVSAWIDGEHLVVNVHDDGEGIAPEHLPRLGERFFRPDESRSREGGGVGLGLAIARSLCESHGGVLTVESLRGGGATVFARFQLGSEA